MTDCETAEEQLIQQIEVTWPTAVCLDEENHNIYVAGKDVDDVYFVFVYDSMSDGDIYLPSSGGNVTVTTADYQCLNWTLHTGHR